MSLRRALFVATLALTPSLALLPGLTLTPSPASAAGETQVFLVDNSDGYGIDTCLASGDSCGAAMAGAWCRTHDFVRATGFGKIGLTPTLIAASTTANYGTDGEKVAITCER